MDRQVTEAIQALAGTQLTDKVRTFDAEVISVDVRARTCECAAISAKESVNIPDVRLMAALDDGVFIIPALGSTVTVIDSTYGEPYVSSYSEVSQIILMGGELGGLVKLFSCIEKFNNIEKDINKLKTVFSSWIVVSGDGGAALKAVAAAWAGAALTPTKRADLENTKITQGE